LSSTSLAMDEIQFYCAICGEGLRVKAKSAGGFCDCPRCQRVIPIPGYPGRPGYPAECGPVFSPLILGIEIKFFCESCGSKLRVDARYQGQSFPCAVCQEPTKIPEWGGRTPPLNEGLADRTAPAVRLSADEREFLSAPLEDRGEALVTANRR
jgi:hypothetical protein